MTNALIPAPVTMIVPIASEAPPVFLTVTVCAVLATPTVPAPNGIEVGLTLARGDDP